jgi:hypothetical protein
MPTAFKPEALALYSGTKKKEEDLAQHNYILNHPNSFSLFSIIKCS